MQKLSVNAKRAVAKYGKVECVDAYRLFSEQAWEVRAVGNALSLTVTQANAAINAGRELKVLDNREFCRVLDRAAPVIVDEMVSASGRSLEPGTYTVGVSRVEQVCGRIVRTIDIDSAVESPAYDAMLGRCKGGDAQAGKAFLANSARQLGVSAYVPGEAATDCADGHRAYVGRDAKIEYAFAAPGEDPRKLEYKPLGAIAKLEVISWDEAVPCGDGAVSQGMLSRWLPLLNPCAPSQAFPHGFVDTIYLPMRKGIRKIVIRRKAK